MSETTQPLVAWLQMPQSWAEAAYLVSREAVADSEASSVSRGTFQAQLSDIVAANKEMEAARAQLQAMSSGQPADVQILLAGFYVQTMRLTTRYVSAVRNLVEAIKADCELSSASVETFGPVVQRFDLEEKKLAVSSEAAQATAGAARKLVFEQVGDPEDMCRHSATPFGTYVLDGFPKGWMVSFRFGTNARRIHDRTGLTLENAIRTAQNDFDERVAQCLAPSENELSATVDAKSADTTTPRRARPR